MTKILPWEFVTLSRIYSPDVQAGLPDGRYVAAVCEPYSANLRERLRAAWWVLTGRAHAFIYPRHGELEDIGLRVPGLTPSPRPFVPLGSTEKGK